VNVVASHDSTGQPAIEAIGLTKSFRRGRRQPPVVAVDGLSLQVSRGETFGLLGADGAGKTTTLRLFNGLLQPDAGQARVAGFDCAGGNRAVRMRLGYMPQRFANYGDLSVLENLSFFARAYGLTREQEGERIPRLLSFARLGAFRDRLAMHLSGGMRKKLALACMLVHEPEIVFLDEPTLGVDPVSRREFWNLLSDLRAERGLTIFVCTPYMDEAERCTRVGLLYEGQLVACDTPRAIKSRLHGQLLEIRASQTGSAQEVLAGSEGVRQVHGYGAALHVLVDDAERRLEQLRAVLATHGIAVTGARTITPRMEDAFVALIGERATSLAGLEEPA
jgi:ABC-2 type transport system ATP-binding protein